MALKNAPVAYAHMLIRKPVESVFSAFTDPSITTKFWFSRSSGSLEKDATVTWHWDTCSATAEVSVKSFEKNKSFLIEWPTPVQWLFTPQGDEVTFVEIRASGFTGSEDEQVSSAIDSMGGFSLVLAACKAYLEYGINLNIVADHNLAST